MQYPMLQGKSTTRDYTGSFGGYNHNLQIGGGELYDMENLCCDDFPTLRTRSKRGIYRSEGKATGMIAKDTLCYTEGSDFIVNGYPVSMGLSPTEKTMVSMGAYVIILPDKKYINTADLQDFGDIEASVTTSGSLRLELCDMDGNPVNVDFVQSGEPEEAVSSDVWVDTSGSTHVVKTYSSAGVWVAVPTTYIKLSATGIGAAFEQYDGVTISGLKGAAYVDATGGDTFQDAQLDALDGSFVIWAKGDDYIVIVGLLDEAKTITNAITVERRMPEMDYLIESENRLWGCRYGQAADGQVVNELYACKLGDFRNWECYMGVATDSYRVSLGSDGPFTGAFTYLGHPTFFKEECLHKVFGSYPAQYQVQTTACRGVERGSRKSLAIVNEVLYYKGRNGICAYDGSLPAEISGNLGDIRYRNAVGGGYGNKYYVSMESQEGRSLFSYDTARNLWAKENDPNPQAFCNARNGLYFIDGAGRILTISGGEQEAEADVEWMAQTGVLGLDSTESKYFPKLSLRVQMEAGAWLEIALEYDDRGVFEPVFHFRSSGRLESFTVPVRPKRCDHMRIRIRGCGKVWIYSITKSVAAGAEQRRKAGLHACAPDF